MLYFSIVIEFVYDMGFSFFKTSSNVQYLRCSVRRRIKEPGQKPVRRSTFSSVSLRDLQGNELSEARLQDPAEGVLVQADRQALHVALDLT